MPSDIMTTREVVALIINLTNIAEILKLTASEAVQVEDFDSLVSMCSPIKLENIANNLYSYAQRLSTLIPDDAIVVGDDASDDGKEAECD